MLIVNETVDHTATSTPVPQWILENAQDLARVVGLIEPLLTPRWNPAAAGAVVRIRRAVDELGRVAAELAHAGIKCEVPGLPDPDDSARLAIANADLADVQAETRALKVQLAETKALLERARNDQARNQTRHDAITQRAAEVEVERDKLLTKLERLEKEVTNRKNERDIAENLNDDKADRLAALREDNEEKALRLARLEEELTIAQDALDDHKNDAERIRILEIDAAHAEKLRAEKNKLRAQLAEATNTTATPTKPPAITRTLALARFTELAKRFEDQAASVNSRDANVAMRACAKALRSEISAAKGPTP